MIVAAHDDQKDIGMIIKRSMVNLSLILDSRLATIQYQYQHWYWY